MSCPTELIVYGRVRVIQANLRDLPPDCPGSVVSLTPVTTFNSRRAYTQYHIFFLNTDHA